MTGEQALNNNTGPFDANMNRGGYPDDGEPLLVIDFRRLLNLLRKNILWIIGFLAAAVLLGTVLTLLATPTYTARSSVLVEQQADQILEGSELTQNNSYQDADRFLQTQVDVLNSQSLAMRVVEAEKAKDDPHFFESLKSELPEYSDLPTNMTSASALNDYRLEQAIILLQENLTITLPRESRVITISFRSSDPKLSARIANAVAKEYIDSNLNRKFDSSSYARDFLARQLQEARAKLETSERELNQYSRAAGLIRVAGQGVNADRETTLSVTNESLVQANAAANQAAADRAAAEDRWEAIARVPVLTTPQALSNPAIQAMIKQKAEIDAQLAAARARYLDDYPAVLALKVQSNKVEQQIQSLGEGIKRSVYLDYRAALEKQRTLQDEVVKLKGIALAEQDRGVQYNVLKRVAETNRSSYDALLERFNQLNATAGSSANNVSLVDEAEIPSEPSSPNFGKNIALSVLAGLVVATAFVFLRDHFDDSIRSPLDVEAKLGIPMLGLIPHVGSESPGNALEQVQRDPKLPISEAYVALVTNLNYATVDGMPKSIAITSSQASEGKSTTANAIAIDLARLGRKVILIDADMRRPTLHRIKGSSSSAGLSDALSGNSRFQDVIVKDSNEPNLMYVFAGPRPPEPSMLLGRDRFSKILEEAVSSADVVVIDCPPMLGLSDTASISAHVSGTLIVIDASQGHRGAIKSSLRRLSLVSANVIGAVLTKFDPKTADSAYGYYGYNYYSYGTAEGD
ncbi:polysaccharide biosynthesis tyrosine autokinase [Novosphingobium sp. ERW19]|uniref:GumC family protein n=1 Tax=Novosphingobium sp. ERW19 TaxID=2726186 RepID=UPI001456ABBE|nr:polysaccharide biosynthesis tyrosine autokinase [Novosphingobium sp. ERW19]NLR41421.1 polysaccharide biosynthesis tyrosine autokinase [Novosphingobium sp. ERW19]